MTVLSRPFDDLGVEPSLLQIEDVSKAFIVSGRTWITISDVDIQADDEARAHNDVNIEVGILIGYWDEAEVVAEQAKRSAYKAGQAQ